MARQNSPAQGESKGHAVRSVSAPVPADHPVPVGVAAAQPGPAGFFPVAFIDTSPERLRRGEGIGVAASAAAIPAHAEVEGTARRLEGGSTAPTYTDDLGRTMVRHGECNYSTCSACCKFVELAVHHAYLEPDKRRWLELHGIRLAQRDGLVWARIDVICQALTEAGACGLFGTPERPQMCADFPFVSADIAIVDDWAGQQVCSYAFEEVPV